MAETPPKITVGAFEVAFLADGLWRNDGGCMFGVVPRELWKGNHPPDERNRIRLNLTCPLIMKGADAVLVDTGIGNRLSDVERKIFDHGDGWLPNHLRALGMEAGDVTHLIVSHLHFDHCGGIVRRRDSGALEAAFPRARIFVQRGELEVADHPRNERLHAAYRHVGEILAPVRSMLEAIDGDTDVIAGRARRRHRRSYSRPPGGPRDRRRRMLHASRRHRADALASSRTVEPVVRSGRAAHDGTEGALPRTRREK